MLVIWCDEIIYAMDIVSTKMTNVLATNTVSINCHNKKDRTLTAIFCTQFY